MNPQGHEAHPVGQLFKLGLAQAVLFFLGALLGRWIGLLLGLDAFGPDGWGNREIFGILLIGLGGGGGVQLARLWYDRKYGKPPR
ncbi:hypothetical protein M2165_001230 [Variovorax sp. TBS-050B]|uniref:hypothetical protein n=1 Tax=Variovorax sp. TBS-050B TaxID=2940551 RepID=UPI00247584EF|nr:hypothetical protein [Variovorax sp. TBS-050B]MDH6591341.1 hypothetical protein [Variovorax sp. TBS-050B]